MRPARKGPENVMRPSGRHADRDASMRPARKGPENGGPRDRHGAPQHRFNEAGPQGAGKRLPLTCQAQSRISFKGPRKNKSIELAAMSQ